jgi:hypothetical protein
VGCYVAVQLLAFLVNGLSMFRRIDVTPG